MRNFILLITLFITLYISAQEHFPYKHPELLVGKTVTVLPIGQYDFSQLYQNFYAGKSFSAYYKGKREIPKEMLEGRKFHVAAVEPNRIEKDYEDYWITLKDTASGKHSITCTTNPAKNGGSIILKWKAGSIFRPIFTAIILRKWKCLTAPTDIRLANRSLR